MTAQSGFYTADQNVSTDPTRQRHTTNQKDVGLEKGPDKDKVSNDLSSPGDECEKVREHFNSLAVTVTSAEIHFSKEQRSQIPSELNSSSSPLDFYIPGQKSQLHRCHVWCHFQLSSRLNRGWIGMPAGGLSASYRSLTGGTNDNVYKPTTVNLNESKFNLMDSLRKTFSFTNLSSKATDQPLLNDSSHNPQLIPRKMPASATAEETALLGTMPSDSMDDIELKSVAMQAAAGRRFSRPDVQEVRVETDRGSLLIAVQGNTKKPAILTYHDIGLNYIANFQAFFNYPEMRVLAENFCIYHVNAPGQEEGAAPLPEDYVYPTMDELASQINFVLGHFGLKYVVGIGVGAGGNILARYALAYPTKVESLVLINVSSTQSGWIEWGYQKLNARHLRSKGMTQPVLDYLMWHHFGRGTEERNQDLVFMYKEYFEKCVQPGNLALFIDSYIRRSDLNMQRSTEPNKKSTLTMPVMNITGAFSPHIEDTVTLNSRLDPVNSSWMKLSDCGMVLEEQPGKVTEALRLFLQGLGYVVRLGRKRIASVPSVSMEGDLKQSDSKESVKSSPWPIRITENPISVVC